MSSLKKFTFAISSADELLVTSLSDSFEFVSALQINLCIYHSLYSVQCMAMSCVFLFLSFVAYERMNNRLVDIVSCTALPNYNLKHFYLPNPSHQFNFSPCNLCTVS